MSVNSVLNKAAFFSFLNVNVVGVVDSMEYALELVHSLVVDSMNWAYD